MQSILNSKVKRRESFRPFAPAVLDEDSQQYFCLDRPSEYMQFVAPIQNSVSLPAVTHVNNSARVQTVTRETNLKFHKLISKFKLITGCSVLVNTSFNIRGKPIVCTPEDAYRCFMDTEIDYLIIGNCLLKKSDQKRVVINRNTQDQPSLILILSKLKTISKIFYTRAIIGAIYFFIFVPFSWVVRLFRKGPISKTFKNNTATYRNRIEDLKSSSPTELPF